MNAQPTAGMQVVTFENPMGIDGFEFVEFAAPPGQAEPLHAYFRSMGFTKVARHKTRPISTYRQGDCTFLINEDPDSFAADFAAKHGPCACGFAIRVNKLAEWVRVQALKNGATPITHKELTKAVAAPDSPESIQILFNLGSTYAQLTPPRSAEAIQMLKGFSSRACKSAKAQSYKTECETAQTLVSKLGGTIQ